MRQPRIQYAKTSEGVSIAYADMGEGAPIVWLSPPFCHVQLDWEIYGSRGAAHGQSYAIRNAYRLPSRMACLDWRVLRPCKIRSG